MTDSPGLGARASTEEVRLAMGWNGGVSLAVWMGGVAVELDCARRAHLDVEQEPVPRRIYNAICLAFDRQLVLDIFAGASAGGVNSALLGAAIFKRRRLHPDFLRSKWLELGDFSGLLRPTNARSPKSIMQGEKFKKAMDQAFDELMSPAGDADHDLCALPSSQSTLKSFCPPLDIQATNVVGLQQSFVDAWGHELVAREYRAPFCFRKPEDFAPLLLATAARASASFPGAFEPFKFEGDALRLAGLVAETPLPPAPGEIVEPTPRWRYAVDGGLLENAPIRQAIELIPSRPASGPVKRFVCYVNANPSNWHQDKVDPNEPALRGVIGYAINLPRTGRDADQWNAITTARQRGTDNADTVASLVALERGSLLATAAALFSPYRRRRALTVIDEILSGIKPPPRRITDIVQAVLTATEDGALLPWLPGQFVAPQTAAQWDWGFLAAQRALYLELDILAGSLHASATNTDQNEQAHQRVATTIYNSRQAIDAAIDAIELGYNRLRAWPAVGDQRSLVDQVAALGSPRLIDSDRDALIVSLESIYATFLGDYIYEPLRRATTSFYNAVATLEWLGRFPYSSENLFGVPPATTTDQSEAVAEIPAECLDHFIERALAIEVVRRALVDDAVIDAAQRFQFTQLAPNASVPIFTATPVTETGPRDPKEKLTGLLLGHFAGFYRHSWRANDFMWGRLDAATRIVDFLVDPDWRTRLGSNARPWSRLATELVPEGFDAIAAADQRELVCEALEDVATNADLLKAFEELDPDLVDYLKDAELPSQEDAVALRQTVGHALSLDLRSEEADTRGVLTRTLLTRALQYEVLRAELGVLAEQTRVDQALGASTDPFDWETSGSLLPVIRELRDYAGDSALPKRLGCAWGEEAASILALRTVSQTALVALAALPGIAMPLARVTTPGRLPFLAVAGVTARSWLANFAAIAAFCAASFYLTTRIITADINNHHKPHQTLLGEIISPPVLAMGIALLVLGGVLLFFIWRAFKSSKHVTNGFWALAVVLSSGVVAIAIGWRRLGLAQALTGSGGAHPDKWTMGLVFVGAVGGIAGVRQLTAVKNLTESARARWSWATPIISLGAAGLILVWATPHLIHALNDGSSWHDWHRIAATASLASVPILIAYFAVQWSRMLASPPPTGPLGPQPPTLGAADDVGGIDDSPESDGRPTEIVAGFLASLSIVASLVGIVFRPLRLITFALVMALLAAAMGSRRSGLPGFAVALGGLCFVAGMAVAIITDNPIY